MSRPVATIHDYYTQSNSPLRQMLPVGYMIHMPRKVVTRKELFGLMMNMDYNPDCYYPKGVRKLRGEVGHDQCYRYILRVADRIGTHG